MRPGHNRTLPHFISISFILLTCTILAAHIASEMIPSHLSANPLPASIISIEDLSRMIESGQSFYVQIELEDCPACEMLTKEESDSQRWESLPNKNILCIEKSEREQAREAIKLLIPVFEYYPSLYHIDNSTIREFPLETLEDFDNRLDAWTRSTRQD